MLAGPTNLWALLNSLQIGFRTLAIEQRSSEVWRVLGAVKTEFQKFGDVLDAHEGQPRQGEQGRSSDAGVRRRAIARQLRERRGAAGARGARRSLGTDGAFDRRRRAAGDASSASCSTAIRRWRSERVLRTAAHSRRAVARGAASRCRSSPIYTDEELVAAARSGRAVPRREEHRRRARSRGHAAAARRSSRCRRACWC